MQTVEEINFELNRLKELKENLTLDDTVKRKANLEKTIIRDSKGNLKQCDVYVNLNFLYDDVICCTREHGSIIGFNDMAVGHRNQRIRITVLGDGE